MQECAACVRILRNMEVVNYCDGRRIGYVNDVGISLPDGKAAWIEVLLDDGKCFSFSRAECARIPWERVERLGEDVILVNFKDESYGRKCRERRFGSKTET